MTVEPSQQNSRHWHPLEFAEGASSAKGENRDCWPVSRFAPEMTAWRTPESLHQPWAAGFSHDESDRILERLTDPGQRIVKWEIRPVGSGSRVAFRARRLSGNVAPLASGQWGV